MQRLMLTVLLVLGSQSGSSEIIDSFFTGAQILERCLAHGERSNICTGYVMGIVDSHAALVADGLLAQPLWCEPEAVRAQQLVREAVKYLNGAP